MAKTRTTINGKTNYYMEGERVLLSIDPDSRPIEAKVISIYTLLLSDSVHYRYTIEFSACPKNKSDKEPVETSLTKMTVPEKALLKFYKSATLTYGQIIATS